MNTELYKIMRCEDEPLISEREIILTGNLEVLEDIIRVHKNSNYLVLYSNSDNYINQCITCLSNIKECSILNSQHCIIDMTEEEVNKLHLLTSSLDMDFTDIVYEMFIKDKGLQWKTF